MNATKLPETVAIEAFREWFGFTYKNEEISYERWSELIAKYACPPPSDSVNSTLWASDVWENFKEATG
jgi:hypothetical protein